MRMEIQIHNVTVAVFYLNSEQFVYFNGTYESPDSNNAQSVSHIQCNSGRQKSARAQSLVEIHI
jgi:hypothetical protein